MSPRYTQSKLWMDKLFVVFLLSAAAFLVAATAPLTSSGSIAVTAPQEDYFVYLPHVANNYCASGFFDDFSNPASGWYTGDDGDIRWQYYDNQYRIEIYNGSWWAGSFAPVRVSGDYTLQVDVANSGNYGPYGLIFDATDDWSEFYVFVVHTDSYFQVLHYDTSQPNPWTLLASWNPLINSSGFRLKVERAASQAKVFINGQFITTVTGLAPVNMKRIGVYVSSFLPGYPTYMDARFDNFQLCGQVTPLARQASSEDLSKAFQAKKAAK